MRVGLSVVFSPYFRVGANYKYLDHDKDGIKILGLHILSFKNMYSRVLRNGMEMFVLFLEVTGL